MKAEEQDLIQLEIFAECESIMKSKRNDYANDDVLSNFKAVSQQIGVTPKEVILIFISTKITRLANLYKGKKPKNESIHDSIVDCINYLTLLECMEKEK